MRRAIFVDGLVVFLGFGEADVAAGVMAKSASRIVEGSGLAEAYDVP